MAIDREKVIQAAQKFVEKKKYDKAILEYQKLIYADPNDARTLLKVGDLQSKMGLHADAIATYEAVAHLYAKQGWALKAIAVYKQVKELIQRHVPQLEERYQHLTPRLAELYQQLGLISDALAALDEMATRFQRQGRDVDAINVFRRVVQLDPTNPLPHLRLAEAQSRVQDIEGALYEFKTAAAQLAALGRRDDALKVLERLLHFRPDPEQARIAAEIYLSRGQPSDGMQALSKLQICFQANPKDLETLALLARAFHVIGQGQKAVEVQKEMARIAKEIGRIDVARNILTELMRIAPHDETVQRLASQSVFPQSGAMHAPQIPPQPPPPVFGATTAAPKGMRAETRPFGHPAEPSREAPPAMPPLPGTSRAATFQGGASAEPPPPPRRSADRGVPLNDPTYEIYEDDIEEADVDELLDQDDEPLVAGGASTASARGGSYEPHAVEEPVPSTRSGGRLGNDAPPPVPIFGEPNEAVARVLQSATGYRNMGMFDRAAETLLAALDDDPRSLDLRVALRDTYFEADRTPEAVDEMVNIASLYVDSLDGESAATVLQDVLAYEPRNARALAMLESLGYEVVDDGQSATEEEAFGGAADGPLPAYDLDEHEEAAPQLAPRRSARPPPSLRPKPGGSLPPIGQIDEPFSDSAGPDSGGSPLPSFDLEGSADYEHDAARSETTSNDSHGLAPAAQAQGDLDDALEEAEFFASRGMYRDARNILAPHYARNPSNPLLVERMTELDELLERRSASGAQGLDAAATEDRAFDIAASLDALDGIESLAPGPSPMAGTQQQVDVEAVFLKFKEGVAQQISIEDSESHYNLGIAYKEMGLTDDAVREFDTAARDPQRECICSFMIGMIEVERGHLPQAIDAFQRGLASSVLERDHETMLAFEVGAAYEAMKMWRDALSFYQRAMRLDPAYRDVAERVRRLSAPDQKPAPVKAAVSADDDFDRAFDDLLGVDTK